MNIRLQQEKQSTSIDEGAFHGLAGEIVRLIEPHSEADPVAMLVQLIVAFGNVVGRNSYFRVEASKHFTNLFVVIVGNSSNGRKGTSWDNISRIFEMADPDWHKYRVASGLSSGEGLIHNVRDSQGEDDGVKDKRLLCVESEFASVLKVLGREGNTLSAVIRNAWDTGNLSTLTKNQPARSTGAHVSIVGHITKAELLRYLADTEGANGFGNRFLWIKSSRSKKLPFGGCLDEEALKLPIHLLRESLAFARVPRQLKRSAEADKLWVDIYEELTDDRFGLLGSITARGAPIVMRIASIFALFDRTEIISPEHLRAAHLIWKYADQSCLFIFGSSTGDSTADDIMGLLKSSPNGATREDIRDFFNRNKSGAQVTRALSQLVSLNLAYLKKEAPSSGRPAERWFTLI